MRMFVVVGLLLATALGGPARHLRYAESSDRRVYAFVFGSRDTCRVIKRSGPPRFELQQYLRRPPGPSHRGETGDTLVKEFVFGSSGRPIHLVPTNDARFLIGLANRAPDGSAPNQDTVYHMEEGNYFERLDYEALPDEVAPRWPAVKRALAREKPPKTAPQALNYGFVTREREKGRVLVGRQSEGAGGFVSELVCFVILAPEGRAELPAPAELLALLDDKEPLLRAGAAWALGCHGKKEFVAPLRAALPRAQGASRAAIAHALVRCGDAGARKTLRAQLTEKDDAGARRAGAYALATLPPDRADAEALAGALGEKGETGRLCGVALARLEKGALPALTRAGRSTQPEKRAATARVLARIDDLEAERRLLALVRDSDQGVKEAAAVALTAPPRAILPENHGEFARVLDACRRARNKRASRRLSILAAHAKIHHEKVLQALVELSSFEPKAIWSLAKLTGEKLQTPEDCRDWWKKSR